MTGNFKAALPDVQRSLRDTGLSRAQLYHLFSSQDMSVHAPLREMRLLKSLG